MRRFSPATIRGYAYDLANFGAFLADRGLSVAAVVPTDLFEYLDWQQIGRRPASGTVVTLAASRPAPATMNRRICAVRGLFEYAVISGVRRDSPVPAARRSSGLRARRHGLLGHLTPRAEQVGGNLVRAEHRLPESLPDAEVSAFLADLLTFRDRAMVLAMLLGGLRSAEVRSLRLADVG